MLRTILITTSLIALAGCATTEPQNRADQTSEVQEIVVTGAKTSKPSAYAVKPAPPQPVVMMQGQALPAPSPIAPPPAVTNGQSLSNGTVLETVAPQYDVPPQIVSGAPVYETVTETVVAQEASTELVTIPPTYNADGSIATPAYTQERSVPAVTKQVTRRVLKSPASTQESRKLIKPESYILRDNRGQIIREFASAEEYAAYQPNPYKSVAVDPVSTFSADVDTASYAMVRPYVRKGQLPPKGSVRVEEMINYFDYDYALPTDRSAPFKPNVAVMPSPWNAETKLVHIGVKGFDIAPEDRPAMNLVFLIDISGSMRAENKLPLLKKSLNILVDQLERDDRVSIVTYAAGEHVLLEGVRGHKKEQIREAIAGLKAEGSTAGQAGMQRAYEIAQANFKRKGVNRVIMATDGDFNVGIRNPEDLKNFVAEKRKTKVYLSMLGFGQGNTKDNRMQALAQNGNGTAGYIDSLREARKFFQTDLTANTFPIADDVKIQVEFNPALVSEYRLIGYETRALARQDFNNDKVDAGDIGAGHTVTAIYEITPFGSAKTFIDPLRYSTNTRASSDFAGEYAFVKLRYKLPGEKTSKLLTKAVTGNDEFASFNAAPNSARWASSVAAYGLKLREDSYMETLSWDDITRMAQGAKGEDRYGYKAEFVELTRDANSIVFNKS